MTISWLRFVRWFSTAPDGDAQILSVSDAILAEADALRDGGRWVEAAAGYARFLQINGSQPAIHVQHAHALKEAGRYREALAAYAHAIALAPDDPEAILHQAHLLKRIGDPAALQTFRRLAALDATAVSAEELSRLEALFGDSDPDVEPEAPVSPTAEIPPPGPATRIVEPLPPGLHPRRRAVRFVADVDAEAPAPKLRVMLDGDIWWSGDIETRPGSRSRQIDSIFSFPEPDGPMDRREVRIEALSDGITPAQASLTLPYAARFEGEFTLGPPGLGGDRIGTARFVDRERLTIAPALRATDADGVFVPIVLTSWRREGTGFEIVFSAVCDGALLLYPMWSTQALLEREAGEADTSTLAAVSTVEGAEVVGRILGIADGHVEGWALRPGQRDRAVIVDIFAVGMLVGCGRADRPRSDLAETIGDGGAHGFRIVLPCGLRENTPLTARARGSMTDFATGRVPARAAGVLAAPARDAVSAVAAAAATAKAARSIAALLLCDGDTAWCDETSRVLIEQGLPVHRIIRGSGDFPGSLDAAFTVIEQDLVLVLGEAALWNEAALAPMAQALAATGAVVAVPILQPSRSSNLAGAPDQWGWSLDLSCGEAALRPSPPSPWLAQAAAASSFVTVAGADWTTASLIDRRRWLEGGGLVLRSSTEATASPHSPAAPIAALAETETILATQAVIPLRGMPSTEPVPLPAASADRLARAQRKSPLLAGALSARPSVIALLVTSTRTDALEGDAIVAREFASALSAVLPSAEFRLIPREPDGGADLAGIDAVISLREDCDPRRFRHLSPSCRVVFWIRNCFDAFLENENWRRADEVWMSSEHECRRFSRHTGLPARLLRIATNLQLFGAAKPDPDLACDICFTGSYWGVHREIATSLAPEILDATVRIFGAGWDAVPELAAVAQGPAPYAWMPAIYASAKLVIDDANHVTIDSGSVNSRVYDAIAAGALPITNGVAGAQETFGDLLPTYRDAHGLTGQIRRWLADEPGRLERVAALRRLVMEKHGFEHRARDAVRFLSEPAQIPFVAVTGDGPEAGAMVDARPAGLAPLMTALARAGWRADWIGQSHWDGRLAASADLRLHVGAAPPPATRAGQGSVAWILSEADSLSARIVGRENAVFVPAATRQAVPDLPRAVRTLDWPTRDEEFEAIVARFAGLR
ncbi:glycosyltransferase family protein [Bosea sp. NPDC055594]